jgi:DNA-binding NarL/FixJ family response regulator
MPRMLSDILASVLAAQPDMEIVGSCGAADLEAAVRAQRPDVIVAEEGWPALNLPGPGLFSGEARVTVLAIGSAGLEARVLTLEHEAVREVSPEGLVKAVREAWGQERRAERSAPASKP